MKIRNRQCPLVLIAFQKILILFSLTVTAAGLFATALVAKPAPYQDIRTDFLSIGANYIQYSLQAKDPEAKEKAWMVLPWAKLQVKVSYLMLNISGEYGSKKTSFAGTSPTGQTGTATIKNKNSRFEYTMGYAYAFSEKFHLVAPYIGLGYRAIRRESESDAIKDNERYEWMYMPIGIRPSYQLFRNFVVTLDLSYRQILAARDTVFTSRLFPATNSDLHLNLRKGPCMRAELPLEYYISQYLGFMITPWYDLVLFGKPVSAESGTNQVVVSTKKLQTWGGYAACSIYF